MTVQKNNEQSSELVANNNNLFLHHPHTITHIFISMIFTFRCFVFYNSIPISTLSEHVLQGTPQEQSDHQTILATYLTL